MAKAAKETDVQVAASDKMKLMAAATIAVISLILFYYFPEGSFFYRVIGVTVGFLVAAGLFFTTVPGRGVGSFLVAARVELQKVVWPTKSETTQTTFIVFILVLIVAAFLWALDRLLSWFMQWLLG